MVGDPGMTFSGGAWAVPGQWDWEAIMGRMVGVLAWSPSPHLLPPVPALALATSLFPWKFLPNVLLSSSTVFISRTTSLWNHCVEGGESRARVVVGMGACC